MKKLLFILLVFPLLIMAQGNYTFSLTSSEYYNAVDTKKGVKILGDTYIRLSPIKIIVYPRGGVKKEYKVLKYEVDNASNEVIYWVSKLNFFSYNLEEKEVYYSKSKENTTIYANCKPL